MSRRLVSLCLLALALSLGALALPAPALAQDAAGATPPTAWTEPDGQGGVTVHLHVFHSLTCPHCQEAMPFIRQMADETPWLSLHEYELNRSQANAQEYIRFANALGEQAMYVPAFFYCGKMVAGYDNADGMGARIRADLAACHEAALAEYGAQESALAPAVAAAAPVAAASAAPNETITLPFVGAVSVASLSLPVLTVVLAGLDAFNPCAFFVLMFLLSLMVHARSRSRMLVIGGVFVLFSALIYFVFMSAWLNVFLWLGELALITLVAGIIAILLALINIKDFFWFKQGVSLSIPESAKPGLFARMRTLVNAESMPAMLGSTMLLAVAANSYELLCTSGFPMVYTRALTLHDLPTAAFYGYLAAYNLIYVLPLLAIVTVFALRFGAHKLSEREGRVLKLLSGIMMLFLGVALVFAPQALNNPLVAVGLLGGALVATFALVLADKRLRPQPASAPGSRKPAPGGAKTHPPKRKTHAAHR